MKFLIFYVLSVFCYLHAKGVSVTEFKTVLDSAVGKIVESEDELHNSMVNMMSNLKDMSTEKMAESFTSTMTLIDILDKKVEAKEKKDCIASEKNELVKIINSVPFLLSDCQQNSSAIGQPIRTKMQDAHKMSLNIVNDLENVKTTCLGKIDSQGVECISKAVNELETSLKGIQDQMETYQIEAGTAKPKILSEAMTCNAKVLNNLHGMITNIQDKLQKCV